MMGNSILKYIKRIIFPPSCVICGRMLELSTRVNICSQCGKELAFASDRVCCKKCGKPIVGYTEKQLCYFCNNNTGKYFDKIVSVFSYEGTVRESIVRLKVNGYREYVDTYTECMAAKFFEEYSSLNFDFMCGAPSHDKKGGKKDFDTVDLLSKALSKKINIRYEANLFAFLRDSQKQSALGYDERQRNMKNNLEVRSKIDLTGKTVLLIDDICTTRATLTECSRALKKSGAKRVFALTLATVNNPR